MTTGYAKQSHTMRPGEVRYVYLDWGDNTAAAKTGQLAAGETVSSCTIAVESKPSGATNPTLGSVTVPANTLSDDIDGRVWSTGEATKVLVTMASDQTAGTYVLKQTAVTSQSQTLIQRLKIVVG